MILTWNENKISADTHYRLWKVSGFLLKLPLRKSVGTWSPALVSTVNVAGTPCVLTDVAVLPMLCKTAQLPHTPRLLFGGFSLFV